LTGANLFQTQVLVLWQTFMLHFILFCKGKFLVDLLYPECCHEFSFLNKELNIHDQFTAVKYTSFYDQKSDDLHNDKLSVDALDIVPNAFNVLGCQEDQIIHFTNSKDNQHIEISADDSFESAANTTDDFQLSDLLVKEIYSNHEEADLQRLSNNQKECFSSSISLFLDSDVKIFDDEEDREIFPNLFQDQVLDFSLQRSSSLPEECYPNSPIYDKYGDEEKDVKFHKGLKTNEIFPSHTYQQCMNTICDDSCKHIFQESNEDRFNSDAFSEDNIVEKRDQKFLHDTHFQTQFSFDLYLDVDVENEEHACSP